MNTRKTQLIVALDVGTLDEAKRLVDGLGPDVDIFKVGSQLFTACGPDALRYLCKAGKQVFLDLKFHDIPNTVANAVESVTRLAADGAGVFMCTLHIAGGREMLAAAAAAATKTAQTIGVTRPWLTGITVLTSEEKRDNIAELVLERALLAREIGLDGVVASSREAALIRKHCGQEFIIVTPGIRPVGEATQDQKRVATPSEARANGSDFIVVGRPVVQAKNPAEAAKRILDELNR